MKKTGEFLKKAREEKGLSIHEIGLSLKINPKILKQIEDGDKNNLPAKTFLRGFVQSYAQFLKLDQNLVLSLFTEEMGTTKPKQLSLVHSSQSKGNDLLISEAKESDDLGLRSASSAPVKSEGFELKNIIVGGVVILLLLGLIAVRKIVEKYQKEADVDIVRTEDAIKGSLPIDLPQPPAPITKAPEPSLPQQQPASPTPNSASPAAPALGTTNSQQATNQQPVPSVTAPKLPPAAVTPSPAPTAANPVATPTPQPAPTPTPVKPPVPVVPPKPAIAVTPPTEPSTNSAAPVAAPAPPPKEEPKKPRTVELVIEAFENVEIELVQASGKIEKIKLATNQIQTISATSGGRINISNGGAVNLIVNGKNLGVPGDLGKPKRVSF